MHPLKNITCLLPGFSFKLGQGDIYYGLVNISVNGVWGTLCDPNWNHASAAVLCRMIGYSDGELWYAKNQPTNQLSEPLWGSKLQCQGNEKKLDDCSSVGWVPASQVCSSFSYLATAYCYGRGKPQENNSRITANCKKKK